MSHLPIVSDPSNNIMSMTAHRDSPWSKKPVAAKLLPDLSTQSPPVQKSTFASNNQFSIQWEETGNRQRLEKTTVVDIIESKRILTIECSKEILRLTRLVRDLQQKQRKLRKAFELKHPSRYPDHPPSSRYPCTSNLSEENESVWPKKVTAIGIRKVLKSVQFDGLDVSALFGGRGLEDANCAAGRALGDQETDVHQVEIEIVEKRENAEKTEYQVRKNISFLRWETLDNLKKENLHDVVEIFDRKWKEHSSAGKNDLQKPFALEKTESTSTVISSRKQNGFSTLSGNNSYDEVELLHPAMETNSFQKAENELPNEQKEIYPEPSDVTDQNDNQQLSVCVPTNSDSDVDEVSANWFDQTSEESYLFSPIPSSENLTTEVRSPINTSSERSPSSPSQSSEMLFTRPPANVSHSKPDVGTLKKQS